MPGYIFSEDFVLKDDAGIVFLDYRQPLAIWEWLFGLLRAGSYTGKQGHRGLPLSFHSRRGLEDDDPRASQLNITRTAGERLR